METKDNKFVKSIPLNDSSNEQSKCATKNGML